MNKELQSLGFKLILLLFFLNINCYANTDSVNMLLDRTLKFSDEKTCVKLFLIEICDEANISPQPFLNKAFDYNSQQRLQRANEIISTKANIDSDQITLLSKSNVLSQKWNSTLKVISEYQLFNPLDFMNVPEEEIEIAIKLFDSELPPAIKVNLSNKQINISKDNWEKWITHIKADKDLNENLCIENGVKVDCSKLLRESDFFDELVKTANEMNKDEIRNVIRMTLSFLRFEHDWNLSLKEDGRNVYLVKSRKFSPQVDFLGNLYLPEEFTFLYSSQEQELIINHEAAHVKAFFIDHTLALTTGFIQETFIESESINKVISAVREPDEMLVDLIAVSVFPMEPSKFVLLSKLLDGLETSVKERTCGLKLINELALIGVEPEIILKNRIATTIKFINHTYTLNKSRKLNFEDSRSKNLANRYRNEVSKYLAYISPGKVVAIYEKYEEIDLRVVRDSVEKELNMNDCAQISVTESNGTRYHINMCTLSIN